MGGERLATGGEGRIRREVGRGVKVHGAQSLAQDRFDCSAHFNKSGFFEIRERFPLKVVPLKSAAVVQRHEPVLPRGDDALREPNKAKPRCAVPLLSAGLDPLESLEHRPSPTITSINQTHTA